MERENTQRKAMAKKCIAIATIVAALVLYFIPAMSQDDVMDLGAAYEVLERPACQFTHLAHEEYADGDCEACHHTGDYMPCADCHDTVSGSDDMPMLMDAFHKQCKACHEEKGAGPLACGECHVR